MTFHSYIRVSTDGQRDNSSPEEQRRKNAAVADYHGLSDDLCVFEDLGVSGAIPLAERPGGAVMWENLEEGDVVCVSKLDRAFRSAEDALVTSRKLRERGVDLIVADLSVDPITKNGIGKIFFNLMASFAEFERERISERLSGGAAAKRARGGFGGGRRPFGYDIVGSGKESRLEPNVAEQGAIEVMVRLRRKGTPTRAIAAAVLEETGQAVSHVTVAKILNDIKRTAR